MKTKLLLAVALVGAAGLSAQAGVHFGFSFGLPFPSPVIVSAPAVRVYEPAPVCAAPAVVVSPPVCANTDYVWVPGYWTVNDHRRVWVAGGWQHRPVSVVYERSYGHEHNWYGRDRDDRSRDGYRYDRDDHRH